MYLSKKNKCELFDDIKKMDEEVQFIKNIITSFKKIFVLMDARGHISTSCSKGVWSSKMFRMFCEKILLDAQTKSLVIGICNIAKL